MQSAQPGVPIPQALKSAMEHHQAGRLQEAERIYQEVLKVEPDNPDALHLLGILAHQGGRHEIAIQLIGRALASCGSARLVNPIVADALFNLGNALKGLERHEEALANYDKALEIKPGLTEALNNRGIALKELKRFEEAIASYDRAITIRPDFAEAHANRGAALIALRRLEEALGSADEAIRLRPAFAMALIHRADALKGLKRLDEAIASYDRALAINPEAADAWTNRGNALKELRRIEDAIASYDRALAIRPGFALALSNRGIALQELDRFEEALASFGRAIAINAGFPEAHFNEGLCRLRMGDFEGGWAKYEWRWKCNDFTSPRRDFAQPLWLGDADIAGKTILLHAEQGLGDTIQFARYTQAVAQKGAKVILEVQPALKELLSSIPGAHRVMGAGEPLPAFDFHCPLLSLPLAFKTRLATIPASTPYLPTDKGAVSAWRAQLAVTDQPLVGLCWKGSPVHKGDRERSIRLKDLEPLLASRGVRFVSLQKDLSEEERAITAGTKNFIHPGADFKDTAAIVGALDLVISVDTAWAHWAGAIGKKVWVLLSFAPDWRWLAERGDSPWYPSARLFRQVRAGDWHAVIHDVLRDLPRTGNTLVTAPRGAR
jgi:tetratricopeptide (TPR) repeat protein